jgi:hypothetical protein
MPDKHPYVSAPGNLVNVLNHFRGSFPAKVNADTLKKLGYAPKNESYVLNVLRFLSLIDEEGKKTTEATQAFSLHDTGKFSAKFGEIVKTAYVDLFELHGDSAWTLDEAGLITFFRSTDHTTAIVGKRQASTFTLLAAFSGHGEVPAPKAAGKKGAATTKPTPVSKKAQASGVPKQSSDLAKPPPAPNEPHVGLTVRIEINLPADGDQETYDRIFRSIRENLINAKIS